MQWQTFPLVLIFGPYCGQMTCKAADFLPRGADRRGCSVGKTSPVRGGLGGTNSQSDLDLVLDRREATAAADGPVISQ